MIMDTNEQNEERDRSDEVEPATCNKDPRCELVPAHEGPCGRYPSGPGFWAPF